MSVPREELRLRVLQLIDTHPEMSQRQIARELGVSLGGVNYALKALVERGYVKADNFRKSGSKVAYLYALTPRGIAKKTLLATTFLGRKLEEYEILKREIEALRRTIVKDDGGDS